MWTWFSQCWLMSIACEVVQVETSADFIAVLEQGELT